MKQKLIYLVFAILLSQSTQAAPQALENRAKAAPEKMKFVPSLGTSSFSYTGSDSSNLSYHSGLSLGAMVQIPSAANADLSYEAGVEYLQAGASVRYIYIFSGEDAISFDQTLHYLTLPVNAQYDFYKTEEGNYYVKGGAALAYLVSAKQENIVFGKEETLDLTDKMNRMDLMMSMGFGYKRNLLGGDLLMDLGYTRGTQQVNKESAGKNAGFLAKVSYTIEI